MIGYLIRRMLWAGVLVLAVTLVTYIIFFVIPRPIAAPPSRTRTAVEAQQDPRFAYRLSDDSFIVQYGEFVWRLARHGAMGDSLATRRHVNDILKTAAPVTMSLVLGGALIWLLIAFPIGILSALRPRSLLDRAAMLFVLIGISVHPVWLGLILAYFFGFKWQITPIGGYCDLWSPNTYCGGPVQWAYHMLLPWLTFALLFTALYVRMIRATVLEAMSEDYVRTARAKGASEWRIVRRHVVRNATLPVVTMIGMDVGLAFGGALFVETVYGLPGLGRITYQALLRRDLPILVGVTFWTTLAIVTFNLLVDVVYAWIDPRVTVGSGPVDEHVPRAPRLRRRTAPSVPESASA